MPWGLDRHTYHLIALAGGIPAGIAAVAGLAILVYRRRTTGPVFSATTVNDKVMYLVLGSVIVLGIWNTIAGSVFQFGGEYNYREGVSPWFRSIFYLQPEPELMAAAPLGFQPTRCWPSCSSRCGRSPASSTSSRPPSGTSPGPTSCTAPATTASWAATAPRRGWDRVG